MSKVLDLRKAYIEGDEAILPILGDWYEDQGDPMHLVIRDWCGLHREMVEVLPLLPDFKEVKAQNGMLYSTREQLVPLLMLRHIPMFWEEFPEHTIFALMQDEPLYGQVLRTCELRFLDRKCGRPHSSEEHQEFRGDALAECEGCLRDFVVKSSLEGVELRKKIKADAMAAASAVLFLNMQAGREHLVAFANTNPYPNAILRDQSLMEQTLRIGWANGWEKQVDFFLANNNHIRGQYGTPQEG